MPMRLVALAVAAALALAVAALGVFDGDGPSKPVRPPGPPPAPPHVVARSPRTLSAQLERTDNALHRAIHAWRSDQAPGTAPPAEVTVNGAYLQRALHLLSRHPGLAEATIRRLPSRLANEARQVIAATRDLRELSAGWTPHRVRTGPPDPLAKLLDYYAAAQRRFGVRWQVLAAVNFVESDFGRFRSKSVAGAQGPMQFMPATWDAYGMGGEVSDPHDAILGAANLLRQAGASTSYARALYAYNPSPLYVDAVQRYARLIARDRDAVYLLYSWRP